MTTGNTLLSNEPLRLRWIMISFAFLATILNYIHRLSFNYLSADGPLRQLIPDDAFGYIGAAFFVAYSISNAFSGFVIDRLGTRLGYSLCMAFWTTAGLIHAFAITPLQFGICRFLLGIGEAGNWPAALKLTSEWFPPHERSTASGIFNSGAALGAIIVPPLVAVIATNYGWQWTFIILAVFGYIWLAAFWFSYYTPEKKSAAEVKPPAVPALKLLKNKFVSRLLLAKIFIEPVWYFVTFWIGRYLADVHHWDLKKIGWFAVIPFVLADLGNILGGYFTQFIIKKGVVTARARRIALSLSGIFMCVPLVIAPAVVHSPMSGLIVFGLSGFGYTSYTANVLALTADVVPRTSASAWGLACIGNGIGGAIFQSLSGITLKAFSASIGYVAAYNFLFLGFGVSVAIGMIILLFFAGPFHEDKTLSGV